MRCKSLSSKSICKSIINQIYLFVTNTFMVHIVYYLTIFCLKTIFFFNIIFSIAIVNIYLIFKRLILIFYNVCLFNSLPNRKYSNLLTVAAFSNKPFSVNHLHLLKRHIYKHFQMINLTS